MRWVGAVVASVALVTLSGCSSPDDPGRTEYQYCGISFGYQHPAVYDVSGELRTPVSSFSGATIVLKLSRLCSVGATDIETSEFDSVRELRSGGHVLMLSVTLGTSPASLTFVAPGGTKRTVTIDPSDAPTPST